MPFPHAVRSFAGRRAELDRMIAHVESDVLFFVYGLAGIGKSELVYQLVGELRTRPRWQYAIPTLVEALPGSTAADIFGHAARLARRLDARPHLFVIDDAHHLPPSELAAALGHLSRHVQASRIIVASRREVVLPADARSPVVTTLGPLDEVAAEQMMVALAERRQIPPLPPPSLMRTTHGFPAHIERLVARAPSGASALEHSLEELPPPARRLLRALAIARHRPTRAMLQRIWSGPDPLDDVCRDLSARFVLHQDGEEVIVHEVVRDALLGRATPAEILTAHDDATSLFIGAGGAAAADAVHHAMAAGRHADAWHVVSRWPGAVAAAGGEPLLFSTLARLREELPDHRVAIDLVNVRCLVRASMNDEAARVFSRIPAPSGTHEARYRAVAGEVALCTGERARAADQIDRALACEADRATRFDAELLRASVAVLDGDGRRARALLAELSAATAREQARAGWTSIAISMFDESYEEAMIEAQRAAVELAAGDDLASQLAMLEALAAVECEDMATARAASLRIADGGLRGRVAAVVRAIVRYADGDARSASTELVAAHGDLRARGDSIHAHLAGYYGSAALAELGNLGHARALADQTAQLAERAGLACLHARSLAQQAMLAAEAVQSGPAHRLANAALAQVQLGPRSRAVAHCAHARAYSLEGDTVRAREHVLLARSAVSAPAFVAARMAVDIEHAAVDLVGANLERAVETGERVVEHHRGRPYVAAHARLVLAAAYIARGRRTDLVYAQTTLAQSRSLADQCELRSVQVGCAILSAALARRSQRDRAARDLLTDALRDLDPERGSIYAGTLFAAIDGGAAARVIPGAVALLGQLGFTDAVDCYLVDAQARRAATEIDVARERVLRDLFVDEMHDVIVARRGDVEIRGRPMLCALLSVLVQARGAAVAPDTLYTRVWGVAEYHPLHHRNTLYVAINRLRSSLREVFPERDLIERATAGWRLADGVDACAAVAARGPAKTM